MNQSTTSTEVALAGSYTLPPIRDTRRQARQACKGDQRSHKKKQKKQTGSIAKNVGECPRTPALLLIPYPSCTATSGLSAPQYLLGGGTCSSLSSNQEVEKRQGASAMTGLPIIDIDEKPITKKESSLLGNSSSSTDTMQEKKKKLCLSPLIPVGDTGVISGSSDLTGPGASTGSPTHELTTLLRELKQTLQQRSDGQQGLTSSEKTGLQDVLQLALNLADLPENLAPTLSTGATSSTSPLIHGAGRCSITGSDVGGTFTPTLFNFVGSPSAFCNDTSTFDPAHSSEMKEPGSPLRASRLLQSVATELASLTVSGSYTLHDVCVTLQHTCDCGRLSIWSKMENVLVNDTFTVIHDLNPENEKCSRRHSIRTGQHRADLPPFDSLMKATEPFSVKTYLYCPLYYSGNVVGFIQVERRKNDALTKENLAAICPMVSQLLHGQRQEKHIERLTGKITLVMEIARKLASVNLSEEALASVIVESAKDLIGSDRCSVFFVRPDERLVGFINGSKQVLDRGKGIAGHVAMTGDTVNITDAYGDARFNNNVDKLTGYKTNTILCMPVHYSGQVVGVAQLVNKHPRIIRGAEHPQVFTTDDEELFQSLDPIFGACIHNCRASQQLEHEHKKGLAVIKAITDLTNSDLRDIDSVVKYTMDTAKDLVHSDRVSLFLVDKEHNELYSKLATGGKEIRFPCGKGIAGEVALSGAAENIPDAYEDSRFNNQVDKQLGYRTRSILAEPIKYRGEVLAVAQLVNKIDEYGDVSVFNDEDQDSFHTFSLFAGLAISTTNMLEFAVKAGNQAMKLHTAVQGGQLVRRRSALALPGTDISTTEAVAALLKNEEMLSLLTDVHLATFDLFAVREKFGLNGAAAAIIVLLERSEFVEKYNIDRSVLIRFVCAVKARYRAVPYHNFFHAVDVTQTLYTFLYTGGVASMLNEVECFALLIAAICHDIDHMGLNNSFHLKTESPLGILSSQSGNNSVLEVHHCTLAIEILENPSTALLSSLADEDQRVVFKVLINSILATDMEKHAKLVSDFVEMGQNGYNRDAEDDRNLVMQLVLKSADISNVTKPFRINSQWATCVTEEFYCQGEKEKEIGLKPLPMFDRNNATELAKGQIGFINFICEPFFTSVVSTLFHGMQYALDNLAENKETWQSKLNC